MPKLTIKDAGIVEVDGAEVVVGPKEFALLAVLASADGKVVTRETMLVQGWGYSENLAVKAKNQTRTLDMTLSRLRGKLGDAGNNIQTIRGQGWRLVTME